jgi:diacylglycerol kinase (ATP)
LNNTTVPYAKVIVNPAAGAFTTRHKWPRINRLLKYLGLSFDFEFTEGKGHGIELAKNAAREGYRYLVAVGGDGTVNEVANGILQYGEKENATLGIVSTGTGSDLTRSIGISPDYTSACSCLTGRKRILIDAGIVEYRKNGEKLKRFFVNAAGVGFDAAVVDTTEHMSKRFGGTIPYLTAVLRSFLVYRNKMVTINIGGKTEKSRVLSVIVANGRYLGGGMHIAPEAKLDDNQLDVVVIGNVGRLELLRSLPRVYKGTHLTHPKVRLEKTTAIEIESAEKILVHADGELLGEGPAAFSLIPSALSIVV